MNIQSAKQLLGNNINLVIIQLDLLRNLTILLKQSSIIYYKSLNMFAGIMEKAGKLRPYAF